MGAVMEQMLLPTTTITKRCFMKDPRPIPCPENAHETVFSKTVDMSQLIENVISQMRIQQYSERYIKTCITVWNKLKKYAGSSVHSVEYTPDFIHRFMLDSLNFGCNSKSKNQSKSDILALNILYNYLHFKRISWRKPLFQPTFSKLSNEVFNDYIRYMATFLAISTIESKQPAQSAGCGLDICSTWPRQEFEKIN